MTYTLDLTKENVDKLITLYKPYIIPVCNNYTLFRAKIKSTTLTIFTNYKTMLQGSTSNVLYNEICEVLNINNFQKKESLPTTECDKLFTNTIGSDEVGTGDYFGGIIVCAVFVEESQILKLKQLHVHDSKKTSDDVINKIAPKIMEIVKYYVTVLNNEQYNEIYKINNMNLNKIKAVMHNKTINGLLKKYPNIKYDKIIIDGFCKYDKYLSYLQNSKNVIKDVELIEHSEEKHLAVACASVIARYQFLKKLESLGKSINYPLPKGASKIVDKAGKEIVKLYGIDILNKVAKCNFKNTNRIKE